MHMLHRLSLALVSFIVASAAWAYPEYRVTIVGPANSRAADINSSGAVVGGYTTGGTTRGFVNRGKGVVLLGSLGGTSSGAVAINDKGVVLGNWTSASGQWRGYLYSCGKQRDIGAIYGRTIYRDINNAGYIIGLANPPGSTPYPLSVLRAPNGAITDLGSIATENPATQVYAINNRNQIAAESGPWGAPEQPFRAVIWAKGKFRDLGDFGWEPNGAVAINDRGQATGYASVTTGGPHDRVAFLYSHGRLINIDPRPATEWRYSQGKGINNHGHIVGESDHIGGFIWRGKRMQALSSLVDPKLGWGNIDPQAINDVGQIAATAVRGGVSYAVRLDLIRPHASTAPPLDADAAAEIAALAAPAAQEAALDKAEAEAQAREVVQPAGR